MFATVVDALTRPEEFFERREDPSLVAPAVLVALSGALRIVLVVSILYTLRFAIGPGDLRYAMAVTAGAFAGYVLLRWVLLAGVVYAVSEPLDGEGRFRDLLAYLGWSHLPNVVGGVVMVAAVLVVVTSVDPPTSEAALAEFTNGVSEDPFVQVEAAVGLLSARTGTSLGQLQVVVGLGQLVWGAYVWVAAAKVGRNLDDRRALVAVAVPVLVAGLVVTLEYVDVGVIL